METIVTQIAEKFINNLVKTLTAGSNFTEIEQMTVQEVSKCTVELTSAYLEHLDSEIEADRAGRRQLGYRIERRGDQRKLLTGFGEVAYSRNYYKKAAGGYEYLVDSAMGIESSSRISEGLSLSLADAAKEMSYAKASHHKANEKVSRQTVMWCVRQSSIREFEQSDIRKVPKLHIDADEAHITLRRGKKSEVPLISVYEGIEQQRKRNCCKNGGCTEPRVSHILSSRLSSRPMAWSKTTLKKLSPVLAAGKVDSVGKSKLGTMTRLPKSLQKAAVSANKAFCRGGLALPMPDAIVTLSISGKVTGTQKILKLFV